MSDTADPTGSAPRRTWNILLVLMAAHVIVFAGLSILKYRYYLYADIDFAMFVQATDRLMTGLVYSSIRGLNWLGDHSSLILFPAAKRRSFRLIPILLIRLSGRHQTIFWRSVVA